MQFWRKPFKQLPWKLTSRSLMMCHHPMRTNRWSLMTSLSPWRAMPWKLSKKLWRFSEQRKQPRYGNISTAAAPQQISCCIIMKMTRLNSHMMNCVEFPGNGQSLPCCCLSWLLLGRAAHKFHSPWNISCMHTVQHLPLPFSIVIEHQTSDSCCR